MAVEYGPNAYVVGEDGAPECSPAIPRTSGGESILDFGYRASAPEDYGQALAEHDPNEPVPIAFNDPLVDLTAPAKAAYGKPIPYNWQLTGSCFPAGVPVRMADGNEKPIEQVQVGDEVITHTGKTRKVVNVMCRNYTGDLVTVRPEGFPFPLTATADHPFAVWRDRLTWVPAGDLTEDDRVLVSIGIDEGKDVVLDALEAFTIRLSGDRRLTVYPELQTQVAAAGVADLKVARSCKLTPFGIAQRVKQTTRQAVVSLPVYDFEVEEDHSFVAGGLVVHNCVSGGGFNALVNRIGVEIATGRQAEAFELPFTLMTYGLSRWLAFRDNTEGEGSAGAAFVSAAKEGGLPPFSDPDVPKPSILMSMDGKHAVHAFSRRDEFYWSSVRNHTAGIKERAKKVTIQYVRIRSADQGEVEIRRGRTITWAGMWGGLMRVPVEGGRKDSKVLLNRHASSWSHQQSCSMMWHHRDLGRIWNIQNQWFGPGPNTKVETVAVSGGRAVSRILEAVDVMSVHGDPVDPYSPLGSYWISDADFEYQCARGEVFATYLIGGYSGLVGVGSV